MRPIVFHLSAWLQYTLWILTDFWTGNILIKGRCSFFLSIFCPSWFIFFIQEKGQTLINKVYVSGRQYVLIHTFLVLFILKVIVYCFNNVCPYYLCHICSTYICPYNISAFSALISLSNRHVNNSEHSILRSLWLEIGSHRV